MTSLRDSVLARLDELIEGCRAATPGPWEAYFTLHGDPFVVQQGRGMFGLVGELRREGDASLVEVAKGPDDYGRANALYIAAHDPARMLALYAGLRAEVERHRYEDDYPFVGYGRCIECRNEATTKRTDCPFVVRLAAMLGLDAAEGGQP